MSTLYERRKEEFIDFINTNHTLPRVWKDKFIDGEDMRIWFNKIYKNSKFKDFIKQVNILLNKYNIKILNDKEKEQEFIIKVLELDRVPKKNKEFFSDNDEMNSWYHSYKKKNILFEKRVENSLNEFHNFQIEEIWPRIKKELVYTITKLGCIPEYGKYFTEDGIDIRVICDKLYTFDGEFIEKLLIYLKSEKNIKKALPTKERINELVVCINKLGYIPYFREYRFSDGVDMFTWYNIYIKGNKDIEEKLNSRIEIPNKKRKVNIYLIPNFKSKGGKFYTICSNEGEVLDISNVTSYEEALELDSTLTKRGGVILKKNEEINEVRFVKGKKKDENKRKR